MVLLAIAGPSLINTAQANVILEPVDHPMCIINETERHARSHPDPAVGAMLPGRNGVAQRYLSRYLTNGMNVVNYENNAAGLFN